MAITNAFYSNIRYVKYLVLAGVAVLAVPPIVQYWLSNVRIPDVPVSGIVAMFAGSLLFLSMSAFTAVLFYFLRQIADMDRPVVVSTADGKVQHRPRKKTNGVGTGGSFSVASDETLWAQEQIQQLRDKGVLFETDGADIDAIAKDIGHEILLKQRGRTE